ncbi:MAG: TRAP transporter small permease subunit [Pelagimonas sp.]|uniref:TRAP transporter small permease subunit n=1 Tax=Pelagimonas sp. TaxID=2073170 RepID=UPI003D6A2D62
MIEHKRTGPLDLITWGISRVTMWLPLFIVSIIFLEVVLRYVFQSPTIWVNETSLWVAGMVYLTAGLYSMQQRSHIRIFILYDLAPRWLRRVFDVISTICVCIFAFAVIWGAFDDAVGKFMTWERFGTKFDPPIPATLYPLILITMFLLAIQSVSNLIYDWNTDQGERQHIEDLGDLLQDIGADHIDARPTGSTEDHPMDEPTDHGQK